MEDLDLVAVDDDLITREAKYEKFIWDNLKRNYIGNFAHGMLGMTGFRLINAPTFLPAYLHLVSGSNTIVGLALALQQVGNIISPIFASTRIEHRPKVMPAAVLFGGLGRLAILGMAVVGWFLKGQPLVFALLLFIFLFGVFMGAQRVAFSILLSKVIPLSRRGRLQAWRNATGGLIAAVMAYVAGKYLIGANAFGNGYSTTFVLAFVLTSAGLWVLQLLLREPDPPTIRPEARFLDRLKDAPRLIGEDPAFAVFMLVQMLATSARVAAPFYILYVGQQLEMNGTMLGLLTLAFLGADTVSNLLWGYLGDRSGFRIVLLASISLWIASTVLLMVLHTPFAILAAFAGLGAAQAGYMMAAMTMILEFGDRDDLPMRIGLSTTAEGLTATLGPLIGGKLADAFGYSFVFGTSIGLLFAALAALALIRDPRGRARPV
ncbi:MFS transporter [Phenylobacterium sp.]|uniref:MFS transporter n=1 Tax=Phenylobacterium sp. TaxID=1871053 RepID=UPI0035AD8557